MRRVHMWLGVACGGLFVVLGLTGSAIAWMDELDHALNPALFAATGAGPADPDPVVAMLAADARYGKPASLVLPKQAGEVWIAAYASKRQVVVDPASLAILGERNWSEPGLSRPQLMPTVFHLHRYLLAGETGKIIVGSAGLVLLAIALSGLVIWFPRVAPSALWKAVTVRYGGSLPRFAFSLHRAAGFFAAPVLVVLAFSGSYFNVPAWITPAIDAVAPVSAPVKLEKAGAAATLAPSRAIAAAQALFPEAKVSRLSVGNPYEVRLRQPGELRQGDGATRVWIDGRSGKVLRVQDPRAARGGDKLISWLFPLHSGEAFGLAGRVFISLFGLVPLLFFVTGVYLWWRRRPFKRTADAPHGRKAALG